MKALARAVVLLFLGISSAAAAPEVVCTLPWLGALTKEIAPESEITVLVRANEDPHFISPTPALMAKVRRADLFVENGLNLELWSKRLLDGAGNPRIRPGQAGYVSASLGVPRMEVPVELTRSRGDLHPEGNPHFWLDPLNLGQAAHNIAEGLSRVDVEHAEAYHKRADDFQDRLWRRSFGDDLVDYMGGELLEKLARSGQLERFLERRDLSDRLGGWMKEAASLRAKPVVFFHQSWVYFIERFGLNLVGYVEDRPGISPSAAHRERLLAAIQAQGASHIAVGVYYDDRLARHLAGQSNAKVVRVPGDVGATPDASGLFALYDALIARLGD